MPQFQRKMIDMVNTPLTKLKSLLIQQNLDAVLISSVPNIIYLTGFSSFSTEEREAFLLMTKKQNYILTDGRYSYAVTQKIKNFKLLEIVPGIQVPDILATIAAQEDLHTLGIEADNLTVLEYTKISKLFATITYLDVSQLRAIKSSDEIACIQDACRIGDSAFDYILTKIKKSVTEKTLAFELEWYIRQQNAEISFKPIVAFAQNAAIPHHQATERKLKQNEPVLLDFGVKYRNYCSDMTRTVFFGKSSKKEKKIYDTVLEAQQKTIKYIISVISRSTTTRDLNLKTAEADRVAREYIISQGFPSIPHSLGHNIGLEVHESPRLSPSSKKILQPGMVFSIEPGIYLPGETGVRIEDLFVLEKDRLQQLTNAPKNLIELTS